jgi:hypothetical protein
MVKSCQHAAFLNEALMEEGVQLRTQYLHRCMKGHTVGLTRRAIDHAEAACADRLN